MTRPRKLNYDNPILLDQVPKQELSIAFPTLPVTPTRRQLQVIGLFVLFFVLSGYSLYSRAVQASDAVPWFHALELFFGVILTVLQIKRMFDFHRTTSIQTFFFNAVSVVFLTWTALVENDVDRFVRIVSGAVLIFELFAHRWVLLHPVLRGRSVPHTSTMLVAGSWAMALSLLIEVFETLFPKQLLVFNIVLFLALAILLAIRAGGESLVSSAYSMTVSFVGYPDSDSLAPGILASPSGDQLQRKLLVAFCIVASVCRIAIIQDVTDLALSVPLSVFCKILVAANLFEYMRVRAKPNATNWRNVVDSMATSTNPIEKNSFYVGRLVADGSPVLLHTDLLSEHVHFLGDTGSGKTARGIAPFLEQVILRTDFSVIVLDLKGDSNELCATMDSARKTLLEKSGNDIPMEAFSLAHNSTTFGFNPFLTTGWDKMSIQERAETLACACSLDYGQNYGAGFFSSMNVAPIKLVLGKNGEIRSFIDLYRAITKVLRSRNDELLQSTKHAAAHVEEVMNRFGRIDALNVRPGASYDSSQINACINVGSYFEQRKFGYFSLPSTVSTMSSASVGRMVIYLLMMAAQHVERNHRVIVVIDEFQRLAVQNFESILQLARSVGVSLVLANQSLTDLKSASPQLLNSVEANCHFRQWFSVSSGEDLMKLEKQSGTRTEVEVTETSSPNGSGYSIREVEKTRLTMNHLQAVCDDPNLSIVRIANDQVGYAKYGALPIVVRTEYHISRAEYNQRKAYQIPTDLPGMVKNTETILSANEFSTHRASSPGSKIHFEDDDEAGRSVDSPTYSDWDPNRPTGGL